MATHSPASAQDMLITIKVVFTGQDETRRFKLPLRDMVINTLPNQLRTLLAIPPSQNTTFERYSDSSSSYITLDTNVPSVYKQLYRAAKAKQKLKIRVTVTDQTTTKPAEIPKPGPALPERLLTRCYVHPLPTVDQSTLNTPSTVTVVPSVQASSEQPRDVAQDPAQQAQQPYCWPISEKSGFSEATKSTFEKKNMPTAVPKENIVDKGVRDEAPLPRLFSDREDYLVNHATMSQKLDMIRNMKLGRKLCGSDAASFTICCNNCDKAIPDAHWHCGICDGGDFDLCENCVENGNFCEDEHHFLIQRFFKNGKVIASTTETNAPKKIGKVEEEEKVPGAFTSDIKREEPHEPLDLSRTCNSCVGVFEESNFVTCTVCEDYDLCIPCHVGLKHGHHPNHGFEPASQAKTLDGLATILCAPGRNMRHFAICDGCDKYIYGVRHKCMNCPDWDYCSVCVRKAHKTHPGHRFVPLYEPISMKTRSVLEHTGIFCDGPLCKGKSSYIMGDRYKCAVCHDTDFCANCEALPKPAHNHTHPLIKFKSPIRNVAVTTYGEGENKRVMGDRDQFPHTTSKSTETTPAAPSINAATQVQTVAEVKPTEAVKEEPKETPKVQVAQPIASPELQAHFMRDTVLDGTSMPPCKQFEQTWTLRNPGPHAWPAGCCVCFTGGDGMLNVDSNHPSHVADLYNATRSNIIDRVVEVGEEVDFRVTMRTPDREGKAISYWRLKDATGMPFGHKLWCDVDVRQPDDNVVDHAKSEHIEDISKHAKVDDEVKEGDAQRESKMIFPKLDKESPVSSYHEAEAPAPVVHAPVTTETVELEDVESLGLDDDSDEAFLTDEEYELIATDDEHETAKNGKK